MTKLTVFSLILAATSILPLWGTHYWWVRIFDFPRVQLAALSLVTLLAYGFYFPKSALGWLVLALLVVGLALDAYRIWPYTQFTSPESLTSKNEAAPTFQLISINVRQKNKDHQKVLSLIHKESPDLLVLMETDQAWTDGLSSLDQKYQWKYKVPQENTYGMLFYSNLKVVSIETRHIIDEKVPSIFATIELPDGSQFQWVGVHPRPPRPQEGHSDQRDGELMTIALEIEKPQSAPYIISGDLNDVAWSHTTRLFRRVSGLKDPRVGRGLYNTFPAIWPGPGFPLDHIFHSSHFRLKNLRRLEGVGSDHYPLSITLTMEPEKKNPSEAPDTEDLKESKELKKKGEKWESPKEDV